MTTQTARAALTDFHVGAQGPNVRHFQEALNERLHAHGDHAVEVDGQFGPETQRGAAYAAWFLGATDETVADIEAGKVSVGVQRVIADPTTRNDEQRNRATARRGKQFLRLGDQALNIARHLIGVMETGGNNSGPMVSKIIHANGGPGPEPWCGDFVAYCYRNAGSHAVDRSWASVNLLGNDADVHAVNTPQPGDLVRFSFDHVGLFEKNLGAGTIQTIEGNTGSLGAVSDSPTGGDGVYRKKRGTNLVKDYLRVER